MDDLETNIESYKKQLKHISETIAASGMSDDDELKALKLQLEQLVDLATQSLLEKKKAELLALLEGEAEKNQVETQANFKNEEPSKDFESMVGQKCSAPFKSSAFASLSYHNAVIYGYEESGLSEARDIKDIRVRVVYSLPVEMAMVACPYYIEGRCRFSDSKCKYSHGELVSLSDLKEYVEPDFSYVKEGLSVLAKRSSSMIWEHANIDLVSGNEVVVKWSGSVIETLPFEKIWPLSRDDDSYQIKAEVASDESDVLLNIDSSADALGGWEQHTKGIGSKLMAKMGYVFGSGLGKRSDGRVEPVPTVIYPLGRSLDWCLDRKNGVKNMEDEAQTAKQLEKKLKRESARKKEEEAVFDFINSACRAKSGHEREDGPVASSSKADNIQLKGLRLDHSMGRVKQDISRLEEAASRHRGKDEAVWKTIQEKISAKKDELRRLQSESNSVERTKDRDRNRKKLTVF